MASNSVLDERTLRELYLTAFEIVVKEASPKTIMSAYNKVNDTYANESKHLLMDILRKEWGFDGAVVTDWGGSNDHVEGVKNGSTLEMPSPGLGGARKLLKAVAEGSLTEQEIDARVDELLEVVLSTAAAIEKAPRKFDEAAHHQLARRAAAQSIVLLKNEGDLLPLKYGIKVALIGDFAITPRYQGAGSSMVNPTCVDSLKDAMEKAGLNMVGYCAGYERSGKANSAYLGEAVSQAKMAEAVILCIGLDESSESEGLDRTHIGIPAVQKELLDDGFFNSFVRKCQLHIAVVNDQHPVKVCARFNQARLDRIAQTILGGLVDNVEWLHALHVGQQLSVGAGSGKVHGKISLALARIALQNTELSKGQIRLPKPFHRGQLHVAHADDLHGIFLRGLFQHDAFEIIAVRDLCPVHQNIVPILHAGLDAGHAHTVRQQRR